MADISITAANVLPSASAVIDTSRLAGAAITAGQSVYLDTGTNTYKLADANGASPLYVVAGIALNNAASGQPVAICTKDPGGLTLDSTIAAGDIVWASATPGGITKTFADLVTGWFVTVLGVGIGSGKINMNPIAAGVAK